MKKVFFALYFFCSLTAYSQTWTEPALIAAGRIEYRVITKQEYDRLLNQMIEDGSMCDIDFNDVFYIDDNKPISGTRPTFNGYYYLYGTLTTVVGRSRVLAYGNGNTGRLEIQFAFFNRIQAGSNEFYNRYNKYISRVNQIQSNAPSQSNSMSVYDQLKVWSFTDELAYMIDNPTWGFKATHPGIEVEYSQTPMDQFQAKIDPVLVSGQGAPDIIALESAFVRKYVESGLLLDITDIYEANKSKLLAYPVEVGSYNGKVYAMSWQACPGAMFYRRSLAKKYLGTDDPKTVQTYFSNFTKFLETAKLLKDRSKGSCVVVSSLRDLWNSFLSARKNPWIINDKLVIDPVMEQYLDICKTLHDNRWEGGVGQWSDDWFAGMKGELKDYSGKRIEVFSYFLPTWGLHYVLKTNAPGTKGDWAMIQGPSAYRWGGTWVGAYKGTKNLAAVKKFIRYVATDEAFLETWAKETGDMVNNLNVVNKIKDSYSEPFLGGQNHYALFTEMAKGVNGKLLQGNDEAIEEIFGEAMTAFVNGEKTKAKALADFRAQVEACYIPVER